MGGERKTVMIKIRKIEQKKEIMMTKGKIKEKGIRIDNNLTWREKKMRWKVKEIARQEREKGKRMWIGYGKIHIDGKWWKWDEEEEVLKNNEGVIRGVFRGERGKGEERVGRVRDRGRYRQEGEGEWGGGKGRGGRGIEKEEGWRVVFWNVQG